MDLSGVRSIFSQTSGMPAELCELASLVMGIIYFRRPDTLGDNIREQTSEGRFLKWEVGILEDRAESMAHSITAERRRQMEEAFDF